MERTGKCMCGAVSFTAKEVKPTFSACHCGMCRRWTGGPLLSTMAKNVVWAGEEHIQIFKSSAWAERGFCKRCGSALLYRITAEGPHQGNLSILLGCFDDLSEFTLTQEWFIDNKPPAYALAGDSNKVTEAEAFAMFGGD